MLAEYQKIGHLSSNQKLIVSIICFGLSDLLVPEYLAYINSCVAKRLQVEILYAYPRVSAVVMFQIKY